MTVPTLSSVPNQPKTPSRNFRIPDEEYTPAKAKAESDPEFGNLTAVVRAKLREYVEDED